MGNTVSALRSWLFSRKRLAYKPLPSAQAIRVVQVQSADASNGIVCSLRTLDSPHLQPYHCLSYTWGDPLTSNKALVPTTFEIKVDDGHVTITKNLYDALIQLFEDPDFRLNQLQAIWIDQICINQADTDEKNVQVAMMHDTFHFAASVLAWLGPIDVYARAAIEAYSILNEHEQKNPGFFKCLRDITEATQIEEPAGMKFGHWVGCSKFFGRSYFERMWIFQEIVVAKEITAVCGAFKIPWEDLTDLAWTTNTFATSAYIRTTLRIRDPPKNVYTHLISVWRARYQKGKPEKLHPNQFIALALLHNRTNGLVCRDARDKIYANRGVCETEILPEGFPEGFSFPEVDYGKTTREVYTEFCWSFIQRRQDLRPLNYVEDASVSSLRNDLPSWVPDFSSELEPRSLTCCYPESFQVNKGLDEIHTEFDVSMEYGVLKLSGYMIDTIVDVGESGEEIIEHCNMRKMLQLVAKLPEEYAPHEGCHETKSEAFWRTVSVCTRLTDGYPTPVHRREWLKKWLLFHLAWAKARATLAKSGVAHNEVRPEVKEVSHKAELKMLRPDPSNFIPSTKTVNRSSRRLVKFWNQYGKPDGTSMPLGSTEDHPGMEVVAYGNLGLEKMRLFRTAANYIGKGAQSLKEGDTIWIFPTGEVPYILREVETGIWRFVGAAYIHGIMEGKANLSLNEARNISIV